LGDDCLITCTIFADRLKRTGMSVSFCSEIGRSAYDLAGMTEEAFGFSFMMTAIYAVIKPTDQDFKNMLDRAAGGDRIAAKALGNVTPFKKAGLLH
ncbi:MAG: hypothetical protein ABJK83_09170, partial [Parasphingorhabdus sp.]